MPRQRRWCVVNMVNFQVYKACWTPGMVSFSSAMAVGFSSLVSSEDRLFFSAINLLTPTIHWLTSVTWSTISERWMSSAASHRWLESSEEKKDMSLQPRGRSRCPSFPPYLRYPTPVPKQSYKLQKRTKPHLAPAETSSSSQVLRVSLQPTVPAAEPGAG